MNKKTIALVAHDNRKDELLTWVKKNKLALENFNLIGTGTTAGLVSELTGLKVLPMKSGPLGGDLQIGAKIAQGEVDFLVFFWDPLEAQPHDPDVKALLRVAVLYDILISNNEKTSDYIINSSLFNK